MIQVYHQFQPIVIWAHWAKTSCVKLLSWHWYGFLLPAFCVVNLRSCGETTHWWPLDYPNKRPVMQSFSVFFIVCFNKLLNKSSSYPYCTAMLNFVAGYGVPLWLCMALSDWGPVCGTGRPTPIRPREGTGYTWRVPGHQEVSLRTSCGM